MNSQSNTTKVVTKEGFKNGWDNLPASAQRLIRAELIKSFGCSYMTFYNKMNGKSIITPIELSAIESTFRVYGVNPWTGIPFFDENF
jgi:hypothetical protein